MTQPPLGPMIHAPDCDVIVFGSNYREPVSCTCEQGQPPSGQPQPSAFRYEGHVQANTAADEGGFTQERQAGGHVHERSYVLCKTCDMKPKSLAWWLGYEQGVADAAARQ